MPQGTGVQVKGFEGTGQRFECFVALNTGLRGSWLRVLVFSELLGLESGFKVLVLGVRVQGSGFRVQGSGFRVQGLEEQMGDAL